MLGRSCYGDYSALCQTWFSADQTQEGKEEGRYGGSGSGFIVMTF